MITGKNACQDPNGESEKMNPQQDQAAARAPSSWSRVASRQQAMLPSKEAATPPTLSRMQIAKREAMQDMTSSYVASQGKVRDGTHEFDTVSLIVPYNFKIKPGAKDGQVVQEISHEKLKEQLTRLSGGQLDFSKKQLLLNGEVVGYSNSAPYHVSLALDGVPSSVKQFVEDQEVHFEMPPGNSMTVSSAQALPHQFYESKDIDFAQVTNNMNFNIEQAKSDVSYTTLPDGSQGASFDVQKPIGRVFKKFGNVFSKRFEGPVRVQSWAGQHDVVMTTKNVVDGFFNDIENRMNSAATLVPFLDVKAKVFRSDADPKSTKSFSEPSDVPQAGSYGASKTNKVYPVRALVKYQFIKLHNEDPKV